MVEQTDALFTLASIRDRSFSAFDNRKKHIDYFHIFIKITLKYQGLEHQISSKLPKTQRKQ